MFDLTIPIFATDPVSNIWFDPDTGFSPDKLVTCKANGFPQPDFHWIRTSDIATVAEGPELVDKSANYTYICIATNTVREQTYTVLSAELHYAAAVAGIKRSLVFFHFILVTTCIFD